MGYGGKVAERAKARELRAQSWTLIDIARELGVAKSSVSLWVRDVDFLPNRRRTNYWWLDRPHPQHAAKLAEIERCRLDGIERIGTLSEREFLVLGLALYAGEGSKTGGQLCFANSDPRLIWTFVAWMRRFFDVDESKFRIKLYLHEELDLQAAIEFWSGLTAIPPSQFGKPYRAPADATIRRSKHIMGCPGVVYYSTSLHRHVMGMIEALVSKDAIPG